MIPQRILTALLALAAGWCWGHRTARVIHIPVGATAEQDAAAVADANAAFIAHTRRRFDDMVAGLDLNTPDQEQP